MESEMALEDIKNFFEINKVDKKYIEIIEKNNFWYWSVDNLQKLLALFEDEYWRNERRCKKEMERAEKDFLVIKKVKFCDELSAKQKEELNVLLDACKEKNDFRIMMEGEISYSLRKAVQILINCLDTLA